MQSLDVAHCPEGRRAFPYMSVRENLQMGGYPRSDRAGIERDMKGLFDRFQVKSAWLRIGEPAPDQFSKGSQP